MATKAVAISSPEVREFADQHCGTTPLTVANRCRDMSCLAEKILCHRTNRANALWHSFILERFVTDYVARDGVRTGHLLLWRDAGGIWHAARHAPADASAEAAAPAGVSILHAELVPDPVNLPSLYHTVLLVASGDRVAAVPFSRDAAAAAKDVPWDRLFGPECALVAMQEHPNPFLSLLWLHAALARPDRDPVASLAQDLVEMCGTAVYELHLVDGIVPFDCCQHAPGESPVWARRHEEERVGRWSAVRDDLRLAP